MSSLTCWLRLERSACSEPTAVFASLLANELTHAIDALRHQTRLLCAAGLWLRVRLDHARLRARRARLRLCSQARRSRLRVRSARVLRIGHFAHEVAWTLGGPPGRRGAARVAMDDVLVELTEAARACEELVKGAVLDEDAGVEQCDRVGVRGEVELVGAEEPRRAAEQLDEALVEDSSADVSVHGREGVVE